MDSTIYCGECGRLGTLEENGDKALHLPEGWHFSVSHPDQYVCSDFCEEQLAQRPVED
jgi:hypothetical protein